MRALALSVSTMAEAAAPTRHTGTGIARRAAFHERQRAERAELEAAGGAVLPAEEVGVAQVDAVTVLEGVAECGPNYTLLPSKERKKARRKRQREAAEAAQAQAEQGESPQDEVNAETPQNEEEEQAPAGAMQEPTRVVRGG